MFGFRTALKEIWERIFDFEARIKNLEIKAIGEAYCRPRRLGIWVSGCPSKEFVSFYAKDIGDTVSDKIKIGGEWIDKSDVIFYDDIYNKLREEIKKRHAGGNGGVKNK